jgi:predicted methyltransferase
MLESPNLEQMGRTRAKQPFFLNVSQLAHFCVAAVLQPGEAAIDATVGNGYDTVFLARQVGDKGRVFGFELQVEALEKARKRLRMAGLDTCVTLFLKGHEHMATTLATVWHGRIGAVMFNLGYLPGGNDRGCITRPETTLQALNAALQLLRPGGLISVVAYPGHPGGAEEAERVRVWAAALEATQYAASTYRCCNCRRPPPELTLVWKRPR